MKIKEVLKNGIIQLNKYQVEDANWKVKMLLLYELNVTNEYIAIHMEEEVCPEVIQKFEKHIEELIQGKPLQYITNSQGFYGLDFYVDENVLIPQPDTEILVEEAIDFCKNKSKDLQILDIGTGSGAIAIAISKNTGFEVTASDISQSALKIAEKNARKNNVNINFVQSNLFENIDGKFDLIVSNPPYIETETIKNLSREVRNEPILALDGGKDGLDFYRILAKGGSRFLKQEGILLVEIGYNQKEKVIEIFRKAGFCDVVSKKDFGNQDRIVSGKWRL